MTTATKTKPKKQDPIDDARQRVELSIADRRALITRIYFQTASDGRTWPTVDDVAVLGELGQSDTLIRQGIARAKNLLRANQDIAETGDASERLEAALRRLNEDGPKCRDVIATETKRLQEWEDATRDAQADVARRQRAFDLRRECEPQHIKDDRNRRIQALKKEATDTEWWQAQGRLKQLRQILSTPVSELADYLASVAPECLPYGKQGGVDAIRAQQHVESLRPELAALEALDIDCHLQKLNREIEAIKNEVIDWGE